MFADEFNNYVPKCEQEIYDKAAIIEFIKRNNDCLERSNYIAHITSSAIVVNKSFDKVLFAHHNIYNSWGWVGGHNDGNPNLLSVAIKEAKEETGVKGIVPYSEDIMMIDIIYVPNHIKNSNHVGDHLHLNATYLLIGNEDETPSIKPDENSGVRWFTLEEVISYISEPRMIPIYTKAFNHIKKIKKSY